MVVLQKLCFAFLHNLEIVTVLCNKLQQHVPIKWGTCLWLGSLVICVVFSIYNVESFQEKLTGYVI